MAALGAVTLAATGAVTAPSLLPMRVPTVETQRIDPYALLSGLPLPEIGGYMWADGRLPLRHIVTNVLRTSPLAPSVGLTAASTGARATAVITTTGNFSNNDSIDLYDVAQSGLGFVLSRITFKTSLTASPTTHEVLIGANAAATLVNLQKLVMGTGIQGTDYMDAAVRYGAFDGLPWYPNHQDIEVSAIGASTITFRAKTYGTIGNSYTGAEIVDGGGTYSFTTAWSGGTAATGVDPASGAYQYAYAHIRDEDFAQSAISPITEYAQSGNGNVSLSVIADSANSDVSGKRWFRTSTGGEDLYRGYDIVKADTTDTDDRPDEDIILDGNITYDPTFFRPYEAGYPHHAKYLARYKGRIFAIGADLAADSCAHTSLDVTFTNGSRTVPTAGLFVSRYMEGRYLYDNTAATGDPYFIVRVTEGGSGTGTLYIDREYEGSGGSKAVLVKDLRDPYELFWSEPYQPNNWPVSNSLKGVTGPVGEGARGLIEAFESLVVFTRTGIWRVTGDGPFAVHQDVVGSGSVSGHGIVMAAGVLYWVGEDGIYQWAGAGQPTRISSMVLDGNRIMGIDDTIARINMAHAGRIVGHYDPERFVIRWAVPMDDDHTNRHFLVFDLQSGTFILDTCEDVTFVASVYKPDGDRVTLQGDIQGVLMQLDVSTSDGVYGIEQLVTLNSSSTTRTMTASSTPFTSGLAGVPVWHMDASGNATRHRVVSSTTSALTLARYITAPATGTQVVVGGIGMDIITGRFTLGEGGRRKTWRRTRIMHDVESVAGRVFVATARNQDVPTVRTSMPYVVVNNSDGEERAYANQRGNQFQLRLFSLATCQVGILGYEIEAGMSDGGN